MISERGRRDRPGRVGRGPGRVPAGAVLRAVLLPGAGRRLLLLHRGDPGRADHRADAGGGRAARRGADRADVRGGAAGRVLQHRGGDRRRRQLPGQVPQDPHPAGEGVLGEVLLPARATWATRCSTPRSAGSASTSATTGTSPRAGGRSAWPGAKIVFNPSATSRGLSQYLWRLEQPAAAVANEYFVGAINRVGVEPLGDNDFYGQTYFADPRGQLVGEAASRHRGRGRRPRPGHGPAAGGPRPVAVLP